MTYTSQKPPLAESTEQLRARIPGWGADLAPADRPAVPRERFDLDTGAHWDFPDAQEELIPRERSIEHAFLTPVFGTAQPLRGLSGAVRAHAYKRYSEARAAHWLLLVLADRIDAMEHHASSLLTLRPDNPITETGVLSEFRRHGLRSRREGHRVDRVHQPLDPVLVGGPWVVAVIGGVAAATLVGRAVRARVRQ
ncbi:hypothetical protein [Cellulomonas sp. URHD0024]|uniref:hypothetical protein n=1 Tax=Cellulomonas sp. URHD0024 TaxID=1302620 RepID=UPI0003FC2AF1|nr:hypothetical protein [Cellulomonas sp. URHD0024]